MSEQFTISVMVGNTTLHTSSFLRSEVGAGSKPQLFGAPFVDNGADVLFTYERELTQLTIKCILILNLLYEGIPRYSRYRN